MNRPYDELLAGKMYVGSADDATCAIADRKATHVFDVRVNGRNEQVDYVYTHSPIEENHLANTIKNGAEQIATAIRGGESVYIHCGSGTGRAAVMAAATLMELKEASSIGDAMNIVLQKRTGARFQPNMVTALQQLYK